MEDMEHRLKTGFKLSFLQHQTEMIPPVPVQCEDCEDMVRHHVDTVQVPPRRAPQPRRALRRPRLCHRRARHLGAGGVSRRLRPMFVGLPGRFQVVSRSFETDET